jgi:NADH-quinone oxidoreductase subunit J
VLLTLRGRRGARHHDPPAPARVRASDRIRMVKMDAVKPQTPAAGEEVQP